MSAQLWEEMRTCTAAKVLVIFSDSRFFLMACNASYVVRRAAKSMLIAF